MAEIKCFLLTNVVTGARAGDLNWLNKDPTDPEKNKKF